MNNIQIIKLNEKNITEHSLCTLKNIKHEGYQLKAQWLKERIKDGLVVKILCSEEDGDVGMIEYIPGKYSWRAVEAENYMLIHCIFMGKKKYQKMGYGNMLIEESIEDAKLQNMQGVVTVCSKSAFLAEKDIFIKKGFELVDTAPPAYELLVKKFDDFENPSFPSDFDERLKKYDKGLTIFTSDQCPFIAKAIKEMKLTAEENGIKPRIIHIKNNEEAHNTPLAYGCFGMIYNGEIVADHPISNGRFKNIMKKIILKK